MSTRGIEADKAAALRIVPVSHETVARLERFAELLIRWQRAVQLVSPSSLARLWTRHIADSLQLVDVAPEARVWADLGSGGGFPGLVIAIAVAEEPGAHVHLIESDTRKAAFLREAAREARAPATVHAARIESAAKRIGPVDVVTARALAPMSRLLALSQPFFERGARGIFLKGQYVDGELTDTPKSWKIRRLPSRTDPKGKIVLVDPEGGPR